jgi:hypothetical protein
VLKQVKQIHKGKPDSSLGAKFVLAGVAAAGAGEKRDPKAVAFHQTVDPLDGLHGSGYFTQSQKVSFLEGLLRDLARQRVARAIGEVNTPQQSAESPGFDDSVAAAVVEDQTHWRNQWRLAGRGRRPGHQSASSSAEAGRPGTLRDRQSSGPVSLGIEDHSGLLQSRPATDQG